MSAQALKRARRWIVVMIVGLLLSGVTAMPLEWELGLLSGWTGTESGLGRWFARVHEGLVEANAKYPFLAYGTDWLAFAHIVLAILFVGAWRDPLRNLWVIEFGMIACVLVIPFALVMGEIRGIPFGWRLIDCSFGVFGFWPLWYCRRILLRRNEETREPFRLG